MLFRSSGAGTVGAAGGRLEQKTDAHGRVAVWNHDKAWLVYNSGAGTVEWAPWHTSTDVPLQAAMFLEYMYAQT